jgi:hypothetical protein
MNGIRLIGVDEDICAAWDAYDRAQENDSEISAGLVGPQMEWPRFLITSSATCNSDFLIKVGSVIGGPIFPFRKRVVHAQP